MISEKYGISIYWEVQIIHDKLVDVEIPVPGLDRNCPFEYFFRIKQPYFRTPDTSEANLEKKVLRDSAVVALVQLLVVFDTRGKV